MSEPSKVTNPHDVFFKKVFSQPDVAAAHFRDTLAPQLVERLDFERMTVVSGTLIDDDLSDRYSDLLFEVPLAGDAPGGSPTSGQNTPAFVYLLFEHQSAPEPRMALRMLRYVVRIVARWAEQRDNRAGLLPLVLPVVLYQRATPWVAPTRYPELVRLPAGCEASVEPFVPDFEYAVQQLGGIDARALPGDTLGRTALHLLRDGADHTVEVFETHADALRAFAAEHGLYWLQWALTYALQVGREVDHRDLGRTLETIDPTGPDVLMTLAEQFEQKGIQQGIQQGQRNMQLQIAAKLLADGSSPEDVAELTGLALHEVVALAE